MSSCRFDLFEVKEGSPIWVCAIDRLEELNLKLHTLMSERQGEYFLLDSVTGHRIAVKAQQIEMRH
jgi:hypothetical protein